MVRGGLLRLPQVLAMYPIGKSTWWEGVKSGRYPKPIRISTRCVAWRMTDIHALLQEQAAGADA
ncbi:helix-turn-helix transcriptional regulator [Variovorax ureilyticus]|uniref:helix-turn-helix transcriptional regulator n=1 Tax=Variovorax ureilyticus TaxID=1836198 RepID=UPI003D671E53